MPQSTAKSAVFDRAAKRHIEVKHDISEDVKHDISELLKELPDDDFSKLDAPKRLQDYLDLNHIEMRLARAIDPSEAIKKLGELHGARTKELLVEFAKRVDQRRKMKTEEKTSAMLLGDILDFEILEKGHKVGRAIGRINVDMGDDYGSGFLVSDNIVLTNWHVLKSKELAEKSSITLDYEASAIHPSSASRDDLQKGQKVHRTFDLWPDRFYFSDETLDFAFVAVKDKSDDTDKISLSSFPCLPLIEQTSKILLGHPVSIIHHPMLSEQQTTKCVSMHMSFLTKINGEGPDSHIYHYTGDTVPSSSGSPVFNSRWEVIALHFASVSEKNSEGQVRMKNGHFVSKDEAFRNENSIAWISNQGTRVSRIVKAMKDKEFDHKDEQAIKKRLLEFWTLPGS